MIGCSNNDLRFIKFLVFILSERRRVYAELGLMAEAERVKQHCPFQPQVNKYRRPTARATGAPPPVTTAGPANAVSNNGVNDTTSSYPLYGIPITSSSATTASSASGTINGEVYSRLHQESIIRQQRKKAKIEARLQERPDFKPRMIRKKRNPNNTSSITNPNDESLLSNTAKSGVNSEVQTPITTPRSGFRSQREEDADPVIHNKLYRDAGRYRDQKRRIKDYQLEKCRRSG